MSYHGRRQFLGAIGSGIGALTLASGPVSAADGEEKDEQPNERFLVDLTEVSREEVPDDVEIVHDIGEIDLLAARGDPDRVPGAASTTPDIAVYKGDGGPVAEKRGPRADNHNHDGPATNAELQWDKRVQDLENLTDKPGGSSTVHDAATGEGTRIAVVDSGVYDSHPDLEGVIDEDSSENFTTDEYDWRPNGAGDHGTHVAGTIAATSDNDGPDGGVLGTAPETELVSLRVFSGDEGATGDVIAALVAAANRGCDAANISLGYPPLPADEPDVAAIEAAYEAAADYARSQGMVIVNSAGNDSQDMDEDGIVSLPTEVDGIFGVAATGPIGYGWGDKHADNEEKWLTGNRLEKPTTEPAFYTNYGSAVDVSAAGGNLDQDESDAENSHRDLVYSTIYETDEDGTPVPGYGWKAGTSMAAPQVSGAVALVRSLRPDADVAEIESLVRETARVPDDRERYHGEGHLDLRELVKRAR